MPAHCADGPHHRHQGGRPIHLDRGDTDRPGEISAFQQLVSGTTFGSGGRVHFWPRLALATLTPAAQSMTDSASRVRHVDPETGENVMPWADDDIYAGSVQALRKLLRPFDGRSVNEPDPASRPRAIRQNPSNSRRGDGHCLRPIYTGEPLLPGGLQLFASRSGLSRDREKYRRPLAGKSALLTSGWTPTRTARPTSPRRSRSNRRRAQRQKAFWSFGNPSPPAEWSTGFNPSTLAPFFHKLWTDLGLNPPPLNPWTGSGAGQRRRPHRRSPQRSAGLRKGVTADASPLDDTELDNGEPGCGPRRAGQPSDEGRVHPSPAGCSVHHTRRDRGSRRRCRGAKQRGYECRPNTGN